MKQLTVQETKCLLLSHSHYNFQVYMGATGPPPVLIYLERLLPFGLNMNFAT